MARPAPLLTFFIDTRLDRHDRQQGDISSSLIDRFDREIETNLPSFPRSRDQQDSIDPHDTTGAKVSPQSCWPQHPIGSSTSSKQGNNSLSNREGHAEWGLAPCPTILSTRKTIRLRYLSCIFHKLLNRSCSPTGGPEPTPMMLEVLHPLRVRGKDFLARREKVGSDPNHGVQPVLPFDVDLPSQHSIDTTPLTALRDLGRSP